MERTSGGVYNKRKSALERLEAQKKLGTKTSKQIPNNSIRGIQSLTESDIKRIDREIKILNSRLM